MVLRTRAPFPRHARPDPRLIACVRGDGTVAVEPGGPIVCAILGMTVFVQYQPSSP